MDLSDSDLQLIKKYLFGRLDRAAENEFSMRFASDSGFRSEVDFHQKLFASLHDREGERLKKMLGEVEAANFPATPQPKNWKWLGWLFAFFLVGGTVWFCFFREKEVPKTEQVFARYFQPFENTEEISTRDVPPKNARDEAWQAFDRREFDRAADLFSKISENERTDATEFFKANALLACGKTEKAVPILEKLEAAAPPGKFAEQSRWYLILANLRLGEPEKSKILLEKMVAETGHFNHKKAVELHTEFFGK